MKKKKKVNKVTTGNIGILDELKSIPILDICESIDLELDMNLQGDCPSGHASEGHKCFTVYEDTNSFYCFNCKEGGSNIDLALLHLNSTDINEACQWLTKNFRPDLQLKFYSPEEVQQMKDERNNRGRVYMALDCAMDYYHKHLLKNQKVINYITGRKVTERFIRGNDYMRFGYVPKNDTDLYKALLKNFGKDIALATGLFSVNESGTIVPFFSDTIVYSYQVNGQTRYLIGRAIKDKIFKKLTVKGYIQNEIFGVDSLGIKNEKFPKSVLIAEGLYDAILPIHAGFPTISPITVSFSQQQIEELVRLTRKFKTVYIVPDPDQAGGDGAIKTAKPLIEAGKDVKIISLPPIEGVEKADLAEYFKIHTAEEFLELSKKAVTPIDFLIQAIPVDTPKTDLKKEMQESDLISLINASDSISQEEYIEIISEKFKVKPGVVKKALKEDTSDQPGKKVEKKEDGVSETGDKFLENLRKAEVYLTNHYKFRQNVITNKVEVTEAGNTYELTDNKLSQIYHRLRKTDIVFSKESLNLLLINPDFSTEYDPLFEYMENLPEPEDKEHNYLKDFTDLYVLKNEGERELFEEGFKKWFVGVLTGVYQTDFCNHIVFIISSKRQGQKKSTLFNRLIPPGLRKYLQVGLDINKDDKDLKISLCNHLLINIDELEGFTKKEIDSFKSLITTTHFDIRLPYEHFSKQLRKRASFMASTNKNLFLNDPSGSRRFLIFEIDGIDESKAFNIDGMYWQARQLFKSGFNYWFDKEWIDHINERNEEFETEELERDLLLKYFEPAPVFEACEKENIEIWSTNEIASYIAEDERNLKIDNCFIRKLGGYLRKYNFLRKAVKEGGNTRYKYAVKIKINTYMRDVNRGGNEVKF